MGLFSVDFRAAPYSAVSQVYRLAPQNTMWIVMKNDEGKGCFTVKREKMTGNRPFFGTMTLVEWGQ
jgi:hypothetical protein